MQPASTTGRRSVDMSPSLNGNFTAAYFDDMHDEIEKIAIAEEVILDPCGHGKREGDVARSLQCKECTVLTTGFVRNQSSSLQDVLNKLKSLKAGVCPERSSAITLLFTALKNYQLSFLTNCGHSASLAKLKRVFGTSMDPNRKVISAAKLMICDECKGNVDYFIPNFPLRKIGDILSRMIPFTHKPMHIHLHSYLALQLDKVPRDHVRYMIHELLKLQEETEIPALLRVFEGCSNFIVSGNVFRIDFDSKKGLFLILYNHIERLTEHQKFHLLALAVNLINERNNVFQNNPEVISILLKASKFVAEEPNEWDDKNYKKLMAIQNSRGQPL